MSRRLRYVVQGKEPGEELFESAAAASRSLERTLQEHQGRGHEVTSESHGPRSTPLWIVRDRGRIIARYRLID